MYGTSFPPAGHAFGGWWPLWGRAGGDAKQAAEDVREAASTDEQDRTLYAALSEVAKSGYANNELLWNASKEARAVVRTEFLEWGSCLFKWLFGQFV